MHPSTPRPVEPGFRLADVDPDGPDDIDSDTAADWLKDTAKEFAELQERLFAEARSGGTRRVLLVLQGMDTSGKGGIIRHVVGALDPQGVQIAGFGAPTPEELEHDFLWRIRKRLPAAGRLGVFDRSHYEDVLIHRVRELSPRAVIEERYGIIREFEAELAASGTTVRKVMLHISKAEQGERLLDRLDRPDKHWKFQPGDITERERWDDYQEAYEIALERTSTPASPWYVVPANRKWYARFAVTSILLDAFRDLDPQWPPADFDVDAERARLLATG